MKSHPEYQYLNLLQDILDHGVKKIDRGTGVASYSIFGRQIRFDLSKNFPLLTTKKVYWKGLLHELYWFMSGQTNIEYLVKNNVHIWDDYPYKIYLKKSRVKKIISKEEFIEKVNRDHKFAKKWGELPKIYGELWRHWPTRTKKTIDQLRWAINEIIEDPGCHNALVSSWNPEYLYTMAAKKDTSYFPICHNLYQINIIEGRVCLQLYQRSCDVFLGVPFNIGSYALLAMIIAQVTGYKPGEFIHTFGDIHIYENHIDQVKEQLKRTPRPFPKIRFTKNISDIDQFKPDQVELVDYDPYPPIKASLTVAGGFFEKKQK